MLSDKQIKEIREYVEKSENPLYFFDDDTDGLCSYLLFYKKYPKGKGVVIKGGPLDIPFLRKVDEYKPDLVIILDKPTITQEFVDKINVPILWIDHHPPIKVEGVRYYNPRLEHPNLYLPTASLAYKIVDGELWLAALGTIGDYAAPTFLEEFRKKYPDLIGEEKEPGRLSYETRLGKLIELFEFILKGKISDVNKSINILTKIDDPYEIINKETPRAKYLYKRYEKIRKEYDQLMREAEKWNKKDKFLIFLYPSKKISLTGDLSKELSYRNPEKIIIIGREKGDEIKLSLRSKTTVINEALKKALMGVRGYGGGHEHTCGGNVKKEDFNKFIEQFKQAIQEQS